MITLSSSKIELWEQCQLKFYAHCVLGLKGDFNFAKEPRIQLGSLLHRLFQDFYKNNHQISLFTKEHNKLENLLTLFESEWQALSLKLDFKSDTENEAYKVKGQKALKNFYSREEVREFHPPLYMEQWFNFHLQDFKLNGRIDRIDRESNRKIVITDYKITDKLPNSSELEDDIQLSIYHLACQHSILKEEPSELILFYPVQGEILRTNRTKEQLQEFTNNIQKILSELKEKGSNLGLYATNPAEWKCNSCGFKANCPEFLDAKENKQITLHEAEKLSGELLEFLKQKDTLLIKIAERKQLLKDYMQKNKLTNLGAVTLDELKQF